VRASTLRQLLGSDPRAQAMVEARARRPAPSPSSVECLCRVLYGSATFAVDALAGTLTCQECGHVQDLSAGFRAVVERAEVRRVAEGGGDSA